MKNSKHPNPYVQKFSQAFNFGLYCSVFLLLVVVASCQSIPARAQVQLQGVAAMCGDIRQLQKELEEGSLQLIGMNEVEMKNSEGTTIKAQKLLIQAKDGKVGTFVVSSSGTTCLLFRDIPAKLADSN